MKNSIRKNQILLIFSSIMALSASAQTFSGGIIGGVSSGTVKITSIEEGFTNSLEGKDVFGYEAGIFLKYKFLILPFFIKPELLYSAREGEVNYIQNATENLANINRTSDFRLEKIEAPVLIGYSIFNPYINIEAGPVYNFIATMNETINGNELELERHGLGYRAGVSSELGPFILHVSYQGLTNISGSGKATYSEPNKIIFGFGLILGSTMKKNSPRLTGR